MSLHTDSVLAATGAIVCLILASGSAQTVPEARVDNGMGVAKRGKELYRRYCMGCHGVRGDGAGENAPYLDPKPRDFTAGVFKCRSTDTGHIPSDRDLYETLGRGLHASAMPSWLPLTRQERIDLVAYVKTFSPRFREEKPEPVVPIPPEPPDTQESIYRGREVYKKMECAKCHGEEGHGDGPSASTLTDSKDRPIAVYDFTTGERFKCGQSNQDLYRIFMTGLDGTPMPSYLQDLKPEQAWDLVHYLRTLQANPKKTVAKATLRPTDNPPPSGAIEDSNPRGSPPTRPSLPTAPGGY